MVILVEIKPFKDFEIIVPQLAKFIFWYTSIEQDTNKFYFALFVHNR
jgi:hypothetical protein